MLVLDVAGPGRDQVGAVDTYGRPLLGCRAIAPLHGAHFVAAQFQILTHIIEKEVDGKATEAGIRDRASRS